MKHHILVKYYFSPFAEHRYPNGRWVIFSLEGSPCQFDTRREGIEFIYFLEDKFKHIVKGEYAIREFMVTNDKSVYFSYLNISTIQNS